MFYCFTKKVVRRMKVTYLKYGWVWSIIHLTLHRFSNNLIQNIICITHSFSELIIPASTNGPLIYFSFTSTRTSFTNINNIFKYVSFEVFRSSRVAILLSITCKVVDSIMTVIIVGKGEKGKENGVTSILLK